MTPVIPDLSLMSPEDRARLDVMIMLDGDPALRPFLYGAKSRPETPRGASGSTGAVPVRWSLVHVLDRLEEAFEVLTTQPRPRGPKMYGNAMPQYDYEQFDLNAQLETAELERTLAARNRVRLQATPAQITRMDQALRWPFEYLADQPLLGKAVTLGAHWGVMKLDDIESLALERGWTGKRQFFQDKMAGLRIITARLVADKVPVS